MWNQILDKKNMEGLMEMLGLKETLDRMAKANGVRWYGHVIRRDDDNISLLKAMMLGVNEQPKRGRPKMAVGREGEESRVEDRKSCRWKEMEGRYESDCRKNEMYPTTFGDEERIELKLDMMMINTEGQVLTTKNLFSSRLIDYLKLSFFLRMPGSTAPSSRRHAAPLIANNLVYLQKFSQSNRSWMAKHYAHFILT